MEPSYTRMFKNWHSDLSSAPKNGTLFMGRITGTNKAKVVWYEGETSRWMTHDQGSVDICQWISFTDFADIRSCAWRV